MQLQLEIDTLPRLNHRYMYIYFSICCTLFSITRFLTVYMDMWSTKRTYIDIYRRCVKLSIEVPTFIKDMLYRNMENKQRQHTHADRYC